MPDWRAELVCTAFEPGQFPEPRYQEIAFAGRSNVGKSSLLNSLIGRKSAAHVSSKPGKTRSINFFKVEASDPFFLVDLPGYGYAARSKEEQDSWRRLIERYITSRENLCLIINLIDFRHGLLKNDRELQEWVSSLEIPMMTVFTKTDKVPRGKRKAELLKYIKLGLRSLDVPILVSTVEKIGLDELRLFVQSHLSKQGN